MRRLVFACAVVLVAATDARPTTLRVPSEYPTINGGLDAAASGDTVLVAPGVYTDHDVRLDPNGILVSACAHLKAGVTLRSEGGPDVTTMKLEEGEHGLRVVWGSHLAEKVSVEGFTITTPLAGAAGAAVRWSAGATFSDCIFRDIGTGLDTEFGLAASFNTSVVDVLECRFVNITWHGLVLTYSSVMVDGCWFESCNISWGAALNGVSSPALVRNTTFLNNPSGAIRRWSNDARLFSCYFEGNTAVDGGAVFLNGDGSVVQGNVFYDNHAAGGSGGGLYTKGADWQVTGNTFHGCTVQPGSGGGAAAFLIGGGLGLGGDFENNVISECSGAVAADRGFATTVTTDCNVYWNNPQGDTDFGYGPNDRVVDPWFCDPGAGDFTLNAASPCLPENSGPCGLIGALGQGCGSVAVKPESWGKVKQRYRGETP